MFLAIFHIRELHVLNTIGNIIGLAVTAGHRPLTRTREQEPMGRLRRTRTREPPGGAQPSPAQAIMAGLLQTRTRELEDGWMARTRAHPPRRRAMAWASRRSLRVVVSLPHPLPPRRGALLGSASGSWDGWAGGPQRIVLLNPPLEEGLGEHARGAGA